MNEKNLIARQIEGSFSAIAGAFVIESLQHMIPWLIATCMVILCDLLFGVRRSMLMGVEVRFSRAIRATMGKMVTYFAFVCMVCMINVAAGGNLKIDVYSCLLVCFIEGCSIVANILRPKGITLNVLNVISVAAAKVFSVDAQKVEGCFEKDETVIEALKAQQEKRRKRKNKAA